MLTSLCALPFFVLFQTPDRFLQRTYNGTTYESNYEAGLTRNYDVGSGEFALQNPENVGDWTMIFVAAELKRLSANAAPPV